MDDKLTALVSPPLEYPIGERVYTYRKANLEKGVLFRSRVKQLTTTIDDGANDLRMVAYCLWLVLKDEHPEVTEDMLMSVLPADISVNDTLVQLGFMKPQAGRMLKTLLEQAEKNPTGEKSSL